MKCSVKNVITITQGSKEEVLIRLTDPDTGERLDLSQFESGKMIFCTSAGVKIEKTITFPITDPKLGILEFTLDSADTLQFDCQMRDFEAELVYTGAGNNKIIIFESALEVTERVC